MAEDMDIEALLEAPYKKKVNKYLRVFYFLIWSVCIFLRMTLKSVETIE